MNGPGAGRRGGACAFASSTAGSSTTIRWCSRSRSATPARRLPRLGRRGSRSSRTTRATSADTARPARDRAGSNRSRVRALQRARPRRRLHGERGAVLVAGLRYAIDSGFDVVNVEPSRRPARSRDRPARAGGLRLLPKDDARRLRPQPAGRKLPLALRLRPVGWQPRPGQPVRLLLQPRTAGRVLRPWGGHRRGLARELRLSSCTGNSFATPHLTGVCALVLGKHPELAPRPAQERALPDLVQRDASSMREDELHAAVAAGVLELRGGPSRPAALGRRGGACHFPRAGRVDLPPRRGGRRARLRGDRGRRLRQPHPGTRFSVQYRDRRLGARRRGSRSSSKT